MSMHPCTYCTTKWTQKGENALEVEREKWWGSWTGTKLVIGIDQNTLCIVIKHSIKYLFANNKVLRFILSHFYSLSFFYLSFICVFILFYLIQLPFFFCSVQRHWKETTTYLTSCPFSLLSFSPGLMQVSSPHSWLCNNRIRLKFCISCSCIDQDIHLLTILQLPGPAESRFTF